MRLVAGGALKGVLQQSLEPPSSPSMEGSFLLLSQQHSQGPSFSSGEEQPEAKARLALVSRPGPA